jgi:hypothetical protein
MATQKLLDAARSGLLPLIQGAAITDNAVTPVQATEMPMQQAGAVAAQPSAQPWYQMKSGGGQVAGETGTPWYKNPNVYNSLALGFNTMRMEPDQGLAAALQNRIKTAQEMAAGSKTASAVANALRAKGFEQEAMLVEQTPSMAGEFAKLLTKGSSSTETIQTREQTAKLLGYEPGSEGYKAIIAGGKPSDVGQGDWDKSKSIRGEFGAIPAVKAFSEQSQAFGRIVASAENPSPAGDLSLIFNFMKVLDPGSTVREGEFANAQNAGAVDERLRGLYNQIVKGTRLSEPQRADFVNRAARLYGNAEQGYMKTEKFYRGLAERAGLNPDEVLPSYRYGGVQPQKQIQKPADVPQNIWDGMSRQQKQEFINAG